VSPKKQGKNKKTTSKKPTKQEKKENKKEKKREKEERKKEKARKELESNYKEEKPKKKKKKQQVEEEEEGGKKVSKNIKGVSTKQQLKEQSTETARPQNAGETEANANVAMPTTSMDRAESNTFKEERESAVGANNLESKLKKDVDGSDCKGDKSDKNEVPEDWDADTESDSKAEEMQEQNRLVIENETKGKDSVENSISSDTHFKPENHGDVNPENDNELTMDQKKIQNTSEIVKESGANESKAAIDQNQGDVAGKGIVAKIVAGTKWVFGYPSTVQVCKSFICFNEIRYFSKHYANYRL
jgi:hypothetical protein